MAEGQLIRKLLPFERNFTQLPNSWVRDRELSLKARGLMAMLMSFEHGFKVSIKQLAGDGHGGVDLIRTAVEELEQRGYLVRRQRYLGGQFMADDWEIVDPSGLSDPALFGYAAAGGITPHRVGKSNAAEQTTALENPTRTALENPTPIKNTKNTLKELPSATTDARGGKKERSAPSTPEPPAQPPCPGRRAGSQMPCSYRASSHECIDCGGLDPAYDRLESGELVLLATGEFA